MNIIVFDTETTDLNKPFCYNVGYIVYNTNSGVVLESKDFVIEQIWHNLPLFSTAYYAEKRPIYISRMKGKTVKMKKFGAVCRELARDIEKYNVKGAYAYNSTFDEKVFNFNCDWFKCLNPFENVPIFDIRGYAHETIVNNDYCAFCEEYNLFTESGNYSTTAEAVYKYVSNNTDFTEEHTALNDSIIELSILVNAVQRGAKYGANYIAKKSIPRTINKFCKIYVDGEMVLNIPYSKMKKKADGYYFE